MRLGRRYNDFPVAYFLPTIHIQSLMNLKTSTGLVAVNDSVPTYTALSLVRYDKGRSLSISCGDHKHKRVGK